MENREWELNFSKFQEMPEGFVNRKQMIRKEFYKIQKKKKKMKLNKIIQSSFKIKKLFCW